MKAISRREWTYVLEQDKEKPVETQSVFHLKHLSRGTYKAIVDGAGSMKGEINFAGAVGDRILNECLVTWENMIDPDTGETIPFPSKVDAALDHLPGMVRAELAMEAFHRQNISEASRKN